VFAGAAARARRDARIQNLLNRLGVLLQDTTALHERIRQVFERQQRLCAKIRQIRQFMPYAVMDRLQHMAKTGDRSVRVEFRYVEKDEDRNGKVIDVVRWRADIVGMAAAPNALDISSLEEIGERLRVALSACTDAEPSAERTEGELRGWAEAIEGVDRCEADLDEATSGLGVFIELTNLRTLCWVCRKDADQIKAARAALQLTGARNAGDSAARNARDRWREEVERSHDGRDFRIP
jgi:hypothetical protein